jgi:hypothetical protein
MGQASANKVYHAGDHGPLRHQLDCISPLAYTQFFHHKGDIKLDDSNIECIGV